MDGEMPRLRRVEHNERGGCGGGTQGKAKSNSQRILYVSGEESQRQIKLRADRLGVCTDQLRVYSETNMANIITCVYQEKPDILIVDSVQTMFNPDISPAPGSVTLHSCGLPRRNPSPHFWWGM